MFDRTINVVQPHSLGIEAAKRRLRSLVESGQTGNRNIVLVGFSWLDATHTLTVDVKAFGTPVHTIVGIEADKVIVTSDEIAGAFPIVAMGVYLAERQIQSMLAKELK